ncbi:MAG: signal peptidase II [Cyanobacteria bacterium]|nr:signal peptidase II [Cyanobacteria bacterium bin.51]
MTAIANRGRRIAWLAAVVVVLLDQLSKLWAVDTLSEGVPRAFIPGVMRLRLLFNTGAAFSLFSQATALLGLVSFGVAVGLVIWIQRQSALRRWQALGVGCLLGGALGNGLDRWRLGGVVDFLDLVPIRFPVFNLADVAINLAVVFLLLDFWEGQRRAGR